jgi:hypothetical protein
MGGTSKKRAKEVDTDALLVKRDAAKKGKAPKGAVQKKVKAPKESEKSAKKRSKKVRGEEEEPKRGSRSSKKKKQKQEEDSSDDEEANEEADVGDDVVADEVDDREEVSDVEDDNGGKSTKTPRTPEEIEAAKAHRKSQVRRKARVRGYRSVARDSGYSANYASSASHLDVATPVLSDAEVIRACQWAPQLVDKPAYSSIEEFEERTELSLESLPKSAAKVIRQSGEAYLRRLTLGAMQRASDQQKARATINMAQAETRPLQRVQKYSFVAPLGLVRFSQGHDNANHRIQKLDDDVQEMAAEKKTLLKEQPKKRDALIAEKGALKKKNLPDEDAGADARGAQDESIAKKRKKRALVA